MNYSSDYALRFGGIARLYGEKALEAISQAHFVVIGLGGVGSWVAESLARSGIGTMTLIEMDEICTTNTNRQIHALQSNVGRSKNEVLTNRIKDLNPEIRIHMIEDFLDKDNIPNLIKPDHHVVIDAMDSVHIKAGLVSYCSALKIRLIVVGSSGGKRDPSKITTSDLGQTNCDPMLAKIRTQLYRHYNFSRDTNRKFRIDAVYSTEQMIYPKPDGTVCMDKQFLQDGVKLDCAGGFGSSVMVTGTFGFYATNKAIDRYLQKTLI